MSKRNRRPTKTHNHEKVVVNALDKGTLKPEPGKVTLLQVLHDDWCNIFTGGKCNCNPEIRLECPQK
jgi:hypothetical protein